MVEDLHAKSHQRRQAAGILLGLAWVFWLHRWVPAMLVVAGVVWAILHKRIEAGLGESLRRRWRRAWPPRPSVLIALLIVSTLALVFQEAPAMMKILPVALSVLALSVILFGAWWSLAALPGWLSGALTVKGERT